MKILMAKSAGFCFGVKRATNMAFAAAGQHKHICSHGPIIHSPQMVEKLSERGIEVVSDIDDIPSGAVIIRSHGVSADELHQKFLEYNEGREDILKIDTDGELYGAVVLAAGWRPDDLAKGDYSHLGYGELPDVITNLQMERMAIPMFFMAVVPASFMASRLLRSRRRRCLARSSLSLRSRRRSRLPRSNLRLRSRRRRRRSRSWRDRSPRPAASGTLHGHRRSRPGTGARARAGRRPGSARPAGLRGRGARRRSACSGPADPRRRGWCRGPG